MSRKIFFFRHPQPIGAKNICYGQTDLDILDKQIIEARDSLTKIINNDFCIYSSPLIRCAKVAKSLNVDVTYSDKLKEISFGIYDGIKWDKVPKSLLDKWTNDIENFKFEDGESYIDLKSRVQNFLLGLTHNEDILLITHAGVIRACLDILGNIPIEVSLNYKIPYATIIDNFDQLAISSN